MRGAASTIIGMPASLTMLPCTWLWLRKILVCRAKLTSFAAVIWKAKVGGNLNRGVVTEVVWIPQW